MADKDQRFLLFFIMGTFFGPDLKEESPQKSILQRIAEGLPPYTSDQLVGSHLKMSEIEQVFGYVLRKADQSVIVKSALLRQFFQGILPKLGDDPSANYPQFPDLFPPALHLYSKLSDENTILGNISIIRKPEICYIGQDDFERFRSLTGLEEFLLYEDASLWLQEPDEELSPFSSSGKYKKTRRIDELMELDDPLQHGHIMAPFGSDPDERAGPAMVILPSFPTKSELSNIVAATKSGFALTGSATKGKVGSSVGLLDIGECNDSYLFRMSLPGVKRDARDFSCEVESDGKVLIRGVTCAGEKTVYRYSHMFEMQTQNLCPPGRFSISFKLPGPVDPQQFSGNFGTDGILEGIVMKDRNMAGR